MYIDTATLSLRECGVFSWLETIIMNSHAPFPPSSLKLSLPFVFISFRCLSSSSMPNSFHISFLSCSIGFPSPKIILAFSSVCSLSTYPFHLFCVSLTPLSTLFAPIFTCLMCVMSFVALSRLLPAPSRVHFYVNFICHSGLCLSHCSLCLFVRSLPVVSALYFVSFLFFTFSCTSSFHHYVSFPCLTL